MKKLTSAVVASSLVLGLVGTAFAAPAEQNQMAFDVLSNYKVVQGVLNADGTVDPDLDGAITRAQLVTIIVRAFGQEDTAKILAGASSFSDVPTNEWYAGYVALAKNIAAQKNIVIGYDDGNVQTFKPNQNVTMVEALAFIMKFLGVAPGTGANWAADTIAAAKDAGIITAADAEAYLADPNAPATRGNAFGLAYSVFTTAEVTPGKTVMTSFVDTEGPELVVNAPAEPTTVATTATITGSVSGATALFLGTDEITTNEDGTFSVEIELEIGENSIPFYAVDLAGNVTEATYDIARSAGVAAKVVATLSAESIAVGETAELTVKVLDENDVEIEANAEDINVTTTDIGTYDEATGVFTAGTKAGVGTITVTYGELTSEAVTVTVEAGELAKVAVSADSVEKGDAVTLTATDEYGNAVEGASFTVDKAEGYVVGSTFIGTTTGTYTITATKGDATATATVGVYGDAANVAIKSTISGLVANGESTAEVLVAVVDANGNTVTTDTRSVTLKPSAAVEVAAYNYSNSTWGSFSAATTGVSANAKDGVAKFKVRAAANSVGQTLKVTGAATFSSEKTADLTFSTVAQVPTSVEFTVPTYLPQDGGAKAIEISVLDQAEKAMVAGSGEWKGTVSVTGPATLSATTFNYQGGNAISNITLTPTAGYTGDVVVTVNIDGLGSKAATAKVVYPTAAAAVKLTAVDNKTSDKVATALSLKAEILDANGVPVKITKDLKVKVVDPDGKTVDLATSAVVTEGSLTNDVLAFFGADSATFTLAATKVGTYTVSVEDPTSGAGKLTASGTVGLSYTAGAAHHLVLNRENTIYVPVSDAKATIEAQLVDQYENTVAAADKVVVVSVNAGGAEIKVNGSALSSNVEVKTDATGKATLNLEALPLGNAYTVTAAIKDVANSSASVTIDVETRVATTMTLSAISATTGNPINAATAGQAVYLRAVVKDQFGTAMENVASTIGLELDNASEILWEGGKLVKNPTNSWAWNPAGYYDLASNGTVTLGKAGLQNITVKSATSRDGLNASYAVSVAPNTAANAAKVTLSGATFSSGTTYTMNLKKGTVSGPITIQMTDAYTNPISVYGGTTISVTAAAKSAVRTAADGANVASISGVYTSQVVYVSLANDASTAAGTNTYTVVFTADSGNSATLVITATE